MSEIRNLLLSLMSTFIVVFYCVFIPLRYRLAPAHPFPVPFEDVYRVVKYFIQQGVLDQYSVDPKRIAISGDSAGGNLAAAVTQQVPDTD